MQEGLARMSYSLLAVRRDWQELWSSRSRCAQTRAGNQTRSLHSDDSISETRVDSVGLADGRN